MSADPAAVPPPDEHERDVRDIAEADRKARMEERVKAWAEDPSQWGGYADRAAAARDVTNGSQSPPEWAVEMAWNHYAGSGTRQSAVDHHRLARLLVSVREGALREAVRASEVSCGCGECEDAILSLLHTPPSGGGA